MYTIYVLRGIVWNVVDSAERDLIPTVQTRYNFTFTLKSYVCPQRHCMGGGGQCGTGDYWKILSSTTNSLAKTTNVLESEKYSAQKQRNICFSIGANTYDNVYCETGDYWKKLSSTTNSAAKTTKSVLMNMITSCILHLFCL